MSIAVCVETCLSCMMLYNYLGLAVDLELLWITTMRQVKIKDKAILHSLAKRLQERAYSKIISSNTDMT